MRNNVGVAGDFMKSSLWWTACLAAALAVGCGGSGDDDNNGGGEAAEGGDSTGDSTSDSTGDSDGGVPALPIRKACTAPGVTVVATVEQVQSTGQAVFFTRFVPESCTKETPCPGLFLVPDGLMGSDDFFGLSMPKVLAAKTGAVVIAFNPPGRGFAAQLSGGTEEFNGPIGQDALKSVFNQAIKKQDTTDELGVISFGFGLSIAAPALARFGANTMADADFLIDVEGMMNRCAITALPLDSATGVTTDGPGANGTKCDFQHVDREDYFPVAAEITPSVLCSPESEIIAATGKDCTDDKWWRAREPNQYIDDLRTDYLRIQMKYDHVAATRWNALLGIYYGVQGDNVKYNQLNNVQANQPLLAVGDDACLSQGCYLDVEQGNALIMPRCKDLGCTEPFNPFHTDDPAYKPMDLETFFTCVLPIYANRMLARQ